MTRKQSLLSYRIAPNGNRKRVESTQQYFCLHWTAKCEDRYGTDQKAIRYHGNIVLIFNKRRYEERRKIVKPIIFQRNVFYRSKSK